MTRCARVRDDRRAAQRRQVVARQRHLRRQGVDRLGQAADDASPGARRAHPARRPAGVRRHAGPAQAGHRARPQGQRHRHRERRRIRRRRRRRLPRRSTPRRRSVPATGGSPTTSTCPSTVVVVNKVDARDPRAGARPARRRRRSSTPRRTSRCRRGRATGSTRSSITSSSGCPRARPTSRRGRSATCPTSSGSPSSCASSCSPSTRDELPYSIATRVSEWEGNRITVEIVVERESQKGMVIGKGGRVLKQVGERARRAAPRGDVPRPAGQGRQGLAAPARTASSVSGY